MKTVKDISHLQLSFVHVNMKVSPAHAISAITKKTEPFPASPIHMQAEVEMGRGLLVDWAVIYAA